MKIIKKLMEMFFHVEFHRLKFEEKNSVKFFFGEVILLLTKDILRKQRKGVELNPSPNHRRRQKKVKSIYDEYLHGNALHHLASRLGCTCGNILLIMLADTINAFCYDQTSCHVFTIFLSVFLSTSNVINGFIQSLHREFFLVET